MILGNVGRKAIDGDSFAAVLAVRDPERDINLLHAYWNDTRSPSRPGLARSLFGALDNRPAPPGRGS